VQTTGTPSVIWDDDNASGTRDAGEPGLAGWTAFLDVDRDSQLSAGDITAVTDAAGQLSFAGPLPTGTFSVYQIVQPNFRQTFPTASQLTWSTDFSTLPISASLVGSATLNGSLHLTEAVNSIAGTFYTPDLTPGYAMGAFTATFTCSSAAAPAQTASASTSAT
jgi:hypothetical protein